MGERARQARVQLPYCPKSVEAEAPQAPEPDASDILDSENRTTEQLTQERAYIEDVLWTIGGGDDDGPAWSSIPVDEVREALENAEAAGSPTATVVMEHGGDRFELNMSRALARQILSPPVPEVPSAEPPPADPAPVRLKHHARIPNDADTKMTPKVVAQIGEALDVVENAYPGLTRGVSIEVDHGWLLKDELSYAGVRTGFGRKEISIAYRWARKQINGSVKKDTRSGWAAPAGDVDGWTAVIVHEMGHVLENSLGNDKDGILMAAALELGVTRDELGKGVSVYAQTNKSELIAEAFMEYTLSPNPRPVAVAIGRRLAERAIALGKHENTWYEMRQERNRKYAEEQRQKAEAAG